MDGAVRLEWDDLAPADATSLVVRHGRFPAASVLHTHDFAEVFVVESGEALHDRDTVEHPIAPGEVVFVQPSDTHRFVAPTVDFSITNIAFPSHVLGLIAEAVPEAGRAWSRNSVGSVSLGPSEIVRVLRLAHDLTRANTRLRLVQLIVEILLSAQADHAALEQPFWFRDALARWQRDEEAMRDGVAGLARMAGRSREHVSRAVKAGTGERAIDVVNEARLELAASLLQTTDDSISRIAYRVGFSGLSHFYRLFKSRFSVTPKVFRQTHRGVVNPVVPE